MNWEKILKSRRMSDKSKQLVDDVMSDGEERTHIEITDKIKEGYSSKFIPTINELRHYLRTAVDPDDTKRRKFVSTGKDNFNNYLKYKIVTDAEYYASRNKY